MMTINYNITVIFLFGFIATVYESIIAVIYTRIFVGTIFDAYIITLLCIIIISYYRIYTQQFVDTYIIPTIIIIIVSNHSLIHRRMRTAHARIILYNIFLAYNTIHTYLNTRYLQISIDIISYV